MRYRFCIATGVGLLIGLAGAAHPQAEVTALAVGSEPLEETGELRLSRFADFSEETLVAVGTRLEVGDLLSSPGGTVDVELSCGEETVLQFSGSFRVLIDDPDTTDCAVDLLSGTLDVVTDQPAEIDSGDVTLGSEGTEFAVTLSRGEEGPDHALTVFDGRVMVFAEGEEQPVEGGKTWRLAGKRVVWGEVGEAAAARAAAIHARLDVARSVAAGEEVADPKRAIEELENYHKAVLLEPADTETRVKLAKAQLAYKQDLKAAYHLKRADVTTEEKLETWKLDKRVLPYIEQKLAAEERRMEARPLPRPVPRRRNLYGDGARDDDGR